MRLRQYCKKEEGSCLLRRLKKRGQSTAYERLQATANERLATEEREARLHQATANERLSTEKREPMLQKMRRERPHYTADTRA